jgi:putative ABC transport system permease protein
MRPDDRELDDEIRGHLALSIKDRVDRGEDPESARRAALQELGYLPAVRDSMRCIWYSRPLETATTLRQDLRVGVRSLLRARGLAATVVVTLALGIGANAAIFSVVRGVLLRPLVNLGEDRLVYIRQSAPGLDADNLTFSVPEIGDLTSRAASIEAFGDFSTVQFTMLGAGEPRVVEAGVVSGSYFDVMGLRPVLGRLIDPTDHGPDAAGVAVLTHRFWTDALASDPTAVGRTIRLGSGSVTIVGVLEPSIPYPADTEIIANVVASPHHLGALMVTERTHRMTELFGRLAPGVSIDAARDELGAAHAAMMRAHPEAYPASAGIELGVTRVRDQIAAPARTVLLILLMAAALVFVIACSNVANLILARSVRRESELAVRAALGASAGALRRALLVESLVLCGAGAALGVLVAHPLVIIVARFVSRFSVRALEVTADATVLWVGAGLAMAAAVLLAYIPRLPSPAAPAGLGLAAGSVRLTPATGRRLRGLAVAQIALSFVLLAGAGTLVAAIVAIERTHPGFNLRQVLAIDVPPPATGVWGAPVVDFLQTATRHIGDLPGVQGVAAGSLVPWRDAGSFADFPFAVEGYATAHGEEHPHGRFRIVGAGFFAVLGIPLLAGRDFTGDDRAGTEPVVIVSESIVRRLFPNGQALGRTMWWTDPVLGPPVPRRIVGIVASVDDENVVPGRALTVYHPLQQMGYAGRLFVHTAGDPYALVAAVTKTIRDISADQAVERAATLADVRAETLAPERLNAVVLSAFAGVALLIAVVGVAGVLAFSVSARTRELGVRLAMGSTPRHLLVCVLSEGALIVAIGIAAGAATSYVFGSVAARHVEELRLPGALPFVGAAAVLAGAALVAALLPAVRAARVDVLQALRSD